MIDFESNLSSRCALRVLVNELTPAHKLVAQRRNHTNRDSPIICTKRTSDRLLNDRENETAGQHFTTENGRLAADAERVDLLRLD